MNCLRYFSSIAIVIIIAIPAFSYWADDLFVVNDITTDLQASRDQDCPWSIAADDSGNVYTVWEDKRYGDLQVYFRSRDYNGNWDSTDYKISNEPDTLFPIKFGHPSICFVPDPYTLKLLVCYVNEDQYDPNYGLELRGNTFDGTIWGNNSYFISDSAGYHMTGTSFSWATNLVSLSDGKVYAFWQYLIQGGLIRLYFNEYDGGWIDTNETCVYTDTDDYHYSRHENACVDPDDNVHLVYADQNGDDPFRIYYLKKGTSDDNFGNYPGIQVSGDVGDTDSYYPYCAVSTVNNISYLHIVWSTDRIFYRRYNITSDQWSSGIIDIVAPANEISNMPSVACDSYGDVHIVWQHVLEGGDYETKYRILNSLTWEWDAVMTLPADPEVIDRYGLPVIISDVYDNLHVLMTGNQVGQGDHDVFYTFYDAPPHITDLHYDEEESSDSGVVLYWSGKNEPDLDCFKVYHKFQLEKWDYIGSTSETTFTDTTAMLYQGGFEGVYYYVKAIDDSSQTTYSDTIYVPAKKIQGKIYAGNIPSSFKLDNNYPNPFNGQTSIKFALPENAHVTIKIYDLLGRKIETLIDEHKQAGYHQVIWDAKNISSGMYFYRIQVAEYTATKKMSLLK